MSAAPAHGGATPCALPGSPLERERAGLDLCVHCGFCLQACPTYLALEGEDDSPRGRLVLMRALLDGDVLPGDADVTQHFDRCLGCRGCESACPSGVPYGRLLEATRATVARERPIPLIARIILQVFRRPRLLALAMAGARLLRWTRFPRFAARLPREVSFPLAMLGSTERPWASIPYRVAVDEAATPVALLTGCVMEGLLPETNRATERVLERNGYRCVGAPGQRCCGALHAHAGDPEGARDLARHNIAAFEASGAEFIAVNAAGCGAMAREYGHLFADDAAWAARAQAVAARVRDVSELLAARGPARGAPIALRVTADVPCHLQHAQRIVGPPSAVLAAIPGLDLVPLTDADQCCGSAGIYNLVEPDVSYLVLDAKLARIAETGADVVVTGNPGCLMHIGAGLRTAGSPVRAVHPIDLLDAAYAAALRDA